MCYSAPRDGSVSIDDVTSGYVIYTLWKEDVLLALIDYRTTNRAYPICLMLFHIGGTAAWTGWGMGVCRISIFCFHVQTIWGHCKGSENWGDLQKYMAKSNSKRMSEANNWIVFVRGNHDNPAYFDGRTFKHRRLMAVLDYFLSTLFLCFLGVFSYFCK